MFGNPVYYNSNDFQKPLDHNEILFREYFLAEYLKDFDQFAACLRMGFNVSFVEKQANVLMSDAYILKRLAELRTTPQLDEKQQIESDKALALSVLREAALRGDMKTKVAAATQLSRIYGMESKNENLSKEAQMIELFKSFAAKANC